VLKNRICPVLKLYNVEFRVDFHRARYKLHIDYIILTVSLEKFEKT
jgi:hypothetical protein